MKVENFGYFESLFIPVNSLGAGCMVKAPDGFVLNDLFDDFAEVQDMEGVAVFVGEGVDGFAG